MLNVFACSLQTMEFQFRKGIGQFQGDTVVLRVSAPGATNTRYEDVTLHADLLVRASGLLTRMLEDLSVGDIGIITLPHNITARALDKFVCAVYQVQYGEEGTYENIIEILEYVDVLDYFQACEDMYKTLDEDLCGYLVANDFPVEKWCQYTAELGAKRNLFPRSFDVSKNKIIRCFASSLAPSPESLPNISERTLFMNRERLMALDKDTMFELWQATYHFNSLFWLPEKDVPKRAKGNSRGPVKNIFKRQRISQDEAAERISRVRDYSTVLETYTIENIDLRLSSTIQWPQCICDFQADHRVPYKISLMRRRVQSNPGVLIFQVMLELRFTMIRWDQRMPGGARAALSGTIVMEREENGEKTFQTVNTPEWWTEVEFPYAKPYTLHFTGRARLIV